MNIQGINNSQSFGMAFRINGYNGAKRLAQKIHGYNDPKLAEGFFVKDVVKPLEKIKSEVVYDGNDVFVIDGVTKDKYKVLYHGDYRLSKDNGVRSYYVHSNGKEQTVDVPTSNDEFYKPFSEDEFTAGVRIAAYLDSLDWLRRQHATESVEETAGRLYSLYKG